MPYPHLLPEPQVPDLPRPRPLARRLLRGSLLGLLAAGAAAGGCVLPQDTTSPFAGPGLPFNNAPRILEAQVTPGRRIVELGGGTRCTETFSVLVEDRDVNDSITVRWYIDYQPGSTDPGEVEEFLPTGTPVRARASKFEANLAAAGSALAVPGDHVVEAVVTDTQFGPNRQPEPDDAIPLPDGGTALIPGYVDSYAWFVKTLPGGCP